MKQEFKFSIKKTTYTTKTTYFLFNFNKDHQLFIRPKEKILKYGRLIPLIM